jgi:uncharacterized protein (DUF305 family)
MEHANQSNAKMHSMHYKKLLIMTVLSFAAMYVLMYSMVNTFDNVFSNVNQFYMAGLMTTTPMVIIELIIMGAMYMNKKLNVILIAVSSIALISFFLFIRLQTGVSDKQFLKSMIPHHASAILMAGKASVQDPEIKELMKNIISSQQAEIDQMKAKLRQLDSK